MAAATERHDTPPRITALRRLLPYLAPYRGRVLLAAVALLLAAGLVLGLGQGVRHLVDEGFAAGSAAALDRTALVHVRRGRRPWRCATGGRFWLVSWLGERVAADLRRARLRPCAAASRRPGSRRRGPATSCPA